MTGSHCGSHEKIDPSRVCSIHNLTLCVTLRRVVGQVLVEVECAKYILSRVTYWKFLLKILLLRVLLRDNARLFRIDEQFSD